MKLLARRSEFVCRQAVALMTDYLEGSLSGADRRKLERHLAGCPNCFEYLRQLRAIIDLSGRVDAGSLDAEAAQSLINVYREWRRS
jgi:anti-sigma factor RsiW